MRKQKNEIKKISEAETVDLNGLLQAVAVPEPQDSLLEIFSISQDKLRRIGNTLTGLLRGFDGTGTPLVEFQGNPGGNAVAACSTVHLKPAHIGSEVVLSFDDGNPLRPIVLGIIKQGKNAKNPTMKHFPEDAAVQEIEVDGERVIIDARKEIVLRCGESSITLTQSGKIIIRGTYVLSNSTGMNEIKGGGVRIN